MINNNNAKVGDIVICIKEWGSLKVGHTRILVYDNLSNELVVPIKSQKDKGNYWLTGSRMINYCKVLPRTKLTKLLYMDNNCQSDVNNIDSKTE